MIIPIAIILVVIGVALYLAHTNHRQYVRDRIKLRESVYAYAAAFVGVALAYVSDPDITWMLGFAWVAAATSMVFLFSSLRDVDDLPG